MTKIRKTRKQLKRQIEILASDSFWSLKSAYTAVGKCGSDKYMGSAITLTIRNINTDKNILCEEFSIVDGLSKETIEAIKADIKRTYDHRISFIPQL